MWDSGGLAWPEWRGAGRGVGEEAALAGWQRGSWGDKQSCGDMRGSIMKARMGLFLFLEARKFCWMSAVAMCLYVYCAAGFPCPVWKKKKHRYFNAQCLTAGTGEKLNRMWLEWRSVLAKCQGGGKVAHPHWFGVYAWKLKATRVWTETFSRQFQSGEQERR